MLTIAAGITAGILYILNMVFEWDSAKAAANLTKHDVSFEEAATVFADDRALDGVDRQHSGVEPRRRMIGRSIAGRVVMVVYTVRGAAHGETIHRIISARRANREERATYTAAD
jgi:uncharacterized protein